MNAGSGFRFLWGVFSISKYVGVFLSENRLAGNTFTYKHYRRAMYDLTSLQLF